jgi:hypothetical protein
MLCYGYSYNEDGTHNAPIPLETQDSVVHYIRGNHKAHQLVITDQNDQLLLLMRDGVDLFNTLDQIGISLNAVLKQFRDKIVEEQTFSEEKLEWERRYDQIGLSSGEIRMRQRVKQACKNACTIADVAEIVRGTYFDAHFLSSDGSKWYRFLNEDDYSITLMTNDGNGEWIDEPGRVILLPSTRIKHLRSTEDIHTFEILD